MSSPTQPVRSGATTQLPAPGRYVVDPARSTVSFTTKHLFGLGTVHGTFELTSAEVVIGQPAGTSSAHAVIDATSFKTDKAKRDTHVASTSFLDVANHPDITFRSDALREQDDAWVATGDITAHGVTAPSELRLVSVEHGDGEVTLTGHVRVDRHAHGITGGRGLAGRHMDLVVEAVATPR